MGSKTRVEKSSVSPTDTSSVMTRTEMALRVLEPALHEGSSSSSSNWSETQSYLAKLKEQHVELTSLNTSMSISQMLVHIMSAVERNAVRLESNVDAKAADEKVDDDWSLSADQMIFMLQNHNLITDAFENDDMQTLRELAESAEFKQVFGEMGFDEAYDRYECALEE